MFERKINKNIIKYLNKNVVFSPALNLTEYKNIKIYGSIISLDGICYKRVNFSNLYSFFGGQLSF